MRSFRDVAPAVSRPVRVALAGLALAVSLPQAVLAQYYGGPRGYYDERPVYEEERVYRAPPRRAYREAAGLNCAATQQGLTGPQPYSCPLPGPKPLGARCFCDLPIASFSPPQTAVGRVVP